MISGTSRADRLERKLSNGPAAWLVGLLGAIALGVFTNVVYDFAKYGGLRLPGAWSRRHSALSLAARARDLTEDGVLTLVAWSRARPLTEHSLQTVYLGRVTQGHWLDDAEWHDRVRTLAAAGDAGRTAYPIRYEMDHHEHPNAYHFRVGLAESTYAESLSTAELVRSRPELRAQARQRLAGGADEFMAGMPPTSLTGSIAVVSAEGSFLVLRRSASVRTFPCQWTVGINETMKYADEPGDQEDFFALARRALREELGLGGSDYAGVVLSWFGWSEPASAFLVIGSVRARLTMADIDERRGQCHSVYEHDKSAWLPFTSEAVSRVVCREGSPDRDSPWSYLAPIVSSEMWRSRSQLT
jgi:hypothetical protein